MKTLNGWWCHVLSAVLLSVAAQASSDLALWTVSDDRETTPFKIANVGVQGAWATSNPVQLKLAQAEAWLRVANGEISVDDGAFSAAPLWVRNGSKVRVRVVANSAWHELSKASVMVGERSATFAAKLADTSPDPFTFTAQIDIARSTIIYSNTVTITGIDMATPISISGGYYALDGGAYTSAAGTVNNGQTVRVYVMSSSAYSTVTTATLTVGDYSTMFTVTTLASGDGGYGGGGSGGDYDSGGGGYGGGGMAWYFVPSLFFMWRLRRQSAR